jgi:hypothetical protein
VQELIIPPEAEKDPESFEILRVWGANGQQHVIINPNLWDDPATYGIMLADLAHHISRFFESENGFAREETAKVILESFTNELNDPNTDFEGEIAD